MSSDEECAGDFEDEGVSNPKQRKCCCAVPRNRVSLIGIMDFGVTVFMIAVAAYDLLLQPKVKEYSLFMIFGFISGICILADIMVISQPKQKSAGILWLFTHVFCYVSWIFVVFSQVRKVDPSAENVGGLLKVTLQPFFELMSLLSLYGWFTWVLAVNWVHLNQPPRQTPSENDAAAENANRRNSFERAMSPSMS